MCGIAGIVTRDGRPLEIGRLQATSARLAHRGPDDVGYLGWDGSGAPRSGRESAVCRGSTVALLHRRLAILDLTDAGWQPMDARDRGLHIVLNGEIYNYRELRAELQALGHRFASQSDTEVLLGAYREWGADALHRLVGMFALAILDVQASRLFLARDFFGIKPLYYIAWRDGFAFASEIDALLTLTDRPARGNPQRLFHYLRFGLTDHGTETMFSGIRQLPAAHYLELSLRGALEPHPVRYWDVDLDQRVDLSFEKAAERLRELFLQSVQLHLRSDVPLGAALSGGIDSSAIVMAMRHLQGDRLDLHTVSYIAEDPEISEERWVDLVGQRAGAVVHQTRPQPEELVRDLERLTEVQGEPFGSTSIYAQYRIFGLARRSGIKVMLDGQGADELLGGYRTYLAARLVSLVRQGRLHEARRFLSSARRLPGVRRADLLVPLGARLLPPRLHHAARRLARRELVPRWLRAEWFERHGVELVSPVPPPRSRDALRDSLYESLTSISLPMLLRYEDRNSMAFSIESRVPFLVPDLVTFVLSLPEHFIVGEDGTTKAVFRRAMRGIVPDAILDRQEKIGFATPEREWLTRLRGWVEDVLEGEAARQVPALSLAGMREEWDDMLAGRRGFHWHAWRWISVIRWTQRFGVVFDS